jgi:hypothetical protein
MSPIFALITLFFGIWGDYIFLPFLAVSFQLVIQEKVWRLRFKIPNCRW